MAGIKIQKFLGTAPKISPELLPDGAAQTAHNVKLFSGDLIPYNDSLLSDSAERTGTIKTLYAMENPTTGALEWLSWTTDVDIVVASDLSDDEQRIYYTGDGSAKITTYDLATTGAEPYPLASYDLGLPLPTAVLTTAAVSFTSATSTHYERDSGNTAILTTAAAHGLRDGNVITVRDFTGSPAEEFNVTNTRITVTSTTKFEYYNAGATEAEAADTNGVVDLAGGTVTRDYVYTWFTPWDEESIASDPSDTLFMKDGQATTITAIPTTAPAGDNFISAMKLYRTLTSSSGTEFYLLSTLWFPQTTALVALTSNVATVTMATHHGFIVGDRFKLDGCTDSVFDIIDGEVTVIVSDTAFSYAVTNANITEKSDTTGTLLHDVAETSDDDARYWGDDTITTTLRERTSNVATLTTAAAHGLVSNQVVAIASMGDSDYDDAAATITVTGSTTFTYANTAANEASTADTAGVITNDSFLDDFDSLNLVDILDTDEYDEPHEDMIGLTMAQNIMLAGFFDNQLCFAEPAKPHAWPLKYRRTFEENIVAIEAIGGALLVLTELYAYRVTGNDPSVLSIARIDTPYPCLSKRSVVNMGYGVVFATHGGLALWSPATGLAFLTRHIHDWDTWEDEVTMVSSMIGTFYNGKYFGSHDAGAFVFERDEKVGGFHVTVSPTYTAAWLDHTNDVFYYITDTTGDIYTWDDDSQPLGSGQWKSKVIVTKDYINLGAARVIADFTVGSVDADAINAFNTTVPTTNAAIWALSQELGSLNGPTDYTDGAVSVHNRGELNSMPLNGDGQTANLKTVPAGYTLDFQLWQDKTLLFTKSVTDDEIFRLPSGYKSDTFEVSVSGHARVRAIHLAETPHELRKV